MTTPYHTPAPPKLQASTQRKDSPERTKETETCPNQTLAHETWAPLDRPLTLRRSPKGARAGRGPGSHLLSSRVGVWDLYNARGFRRVCFCRGGGGGKAGLVSNCVGELGFRGPGFRVP